MLVLPQEVEVGINGSNMKYYEDLGYEIPRQKNKQYKWTVPNGTKILVNVLDIPPKTSVHILVQCDYCGETYSTTMATYTKIHTKNKIQKDSCKNCRGKAISEKKMKYSYEDMIEIFYQHGFKALISKEEYKSSNTRVPYECLNCGHKSKTTLSMCIIGRGCNICTHKAVHDKQRNNWDDIKQYYIDKNCELLSVEEDYKNKDSLLKYVCHCGRENNTSFNSFKKSYYCRYCRPGNPLQHNIDELKLLFKENNCTLLADEYKGSNKKMPYICHCGRESEIDLEHFLRGERCKQCAFDNARKLYQHPYEYVKECFEEQECELISDTYKNLQSLLDFKCSCGNISKVTLAAFLLGMRCDECMKNNRAKIIGDNPGLARFSEEYELWRQEVYERDDYTCQYCGEYGGKLNVHHLDGYHWCIEKRVDVDNGITLCKNCHNEFHHIYGRNNNTREQFIEWLNNKSII